MPCGLANIYQEITFMEVVKTNDAPKMLVLKAFWSVDSFFPWRPRMSFHAEICQAHKTFVKIYHKKHLHFFVFFTIFILLFIREHLSLRAEEHFPAKSVYQ